MIITEHKETAQPAPSSSPSSQTSSPAPSTSSSQAVEPKGGVLLIRVCDARGISLPAGVAPPTAPPQHQQPSALANRSNRDSLTRKQNWWLPYVVLEFDKNEILVDALAGDTTNPIYHYRAHL